MQASEIASRFSTSLKRPISTRSSTASSKAALRQRSIGLLYGSSTTFPKYASNYTSQKLRYPKQVVQTILGEIVTENRHISIASELLSALGATHLIR